MREEQAYEGHEPEGVVTENTVVELRHISKFYGSVRALHDVDFTVGTGRVEALVGENGAGKSTLTKILTGIIRPDSGHIIVDGREYNDITPHQAHELGIAAVAQELSLFPNLTVGANVLINREPRNRLGLIDYGSLNQKASTLISQLGIELDPERPVRELGFAERQLIEVAKALAIDPKVLILDEPTSGLRGAEVEQLFDVVRRLQEQGRSIVFIGHRIAEIFEMADRITVLKDGERVGRLDRDEADSDTVIRLMVGREVESLFPSKLTREEREQLHKERPLLEARDFAVVDAPVSDIDLALWPGEVCGLAGLQGQGQTELLEGLFGVRSSEGTLRVGETHGPFKEPAAAISAQLALVPEDRKSEGLILDFSVQKNITLASLNRLSHTMIVDRKQEEREARRQIDALDVQPPRLHTPASGLSGGNQQKVALGKWLSLSPRVLLLADPTRGVDVGAKQEIYRLVRNLASEGLAILYLSTELTELVALCDRILVMFEGRIVAEFEGDEASEERIAEASVGGALA